MEDTWLKDALRYIVALSEPHIHTDNDARQFADRDLKPVRAPLIDAVTVSTLGGFCDLADLRFEGLQPDGVVAQVAGHDRVTLFGRQSDGWSRRTVFVNAALPPVKGFPFGAWQDHEPFIIGLQSLFTATDDRDYLLQLASNLTAERVRVSDDDGVSQTVNMRAGVVLKTGATAIKSRVTLAPYRTFREVEQPKSEFIFRLRNAGDDAPPQLALFEADGGKWTLDAMESIGRFLRVRLGDQTPIEVVI